MSCPVCRQRKAKRECPALGQSICPVCCGTKRLNEIKCPETCVHLSAARAHPPAVVRRQHEADVAVLLPTLRALTERQHQLFFLFHSVIARHRPDGFSRLLDVDVADAAAAVANTLETAARGVIYEQSPNSPVARRLAEEFSTLLAQIREEGATVYDRETAMTLRAIEQGARTIGGPANPDAYLALMGRVMQASGMQASRPSDAHAGQASPGSIILP